MASSIIDRPSQRALGLAVVALAISANPVCCQDAGDQAAAEAVVFAAFPEADAYSRITRPVDQQARTTIERRLPFKLHFNELGEHDLLVAFRGRRPVGLIYRRIEEAEWGLTEIAWHLTLDLHVLDFQFVRGRNRHMQELEHSTFARALSGRDLDEVITMLKERDDLPPAERDSSLQELAEVTLRSAAKALVVTETVWLNEVQKLHDQAVGFDLFPASATFTRRTTRFELDNAGELQKGNVKVIYAYDIGNTLLGCVIWSESQIDEEATELRWILDSGLRITSVQPTDPRRSVKLLKACTELKGKSLSAPDADNELCALTRGLGAVVQKLAKRGGRR